MNEIIQDICWSWGSKVARATPSMAHNILNRPTCVWYKTCRKCSAKLPPNSLGKHRNENTTDDIWITTCIKMLGLRYQFQSVLWNSYSISHRSQGSPGCLSCLFNSLLHLYVFPLFMCFYVNPNYPNPSKSTPQFNRILINLGQYMNSTTIWHGFWCPNFVWVWRMNFRVTAQ